MSLPRRRSAPPSPRALALAALLGLVACAPAASGPASGTGLGSTGIKLGGEGINGTRQPPPAPTRPPLQAAFSQEGVVWSDGQQACVARVPQLQPVCPRWPAATGAVAWNGGRAWAALPTLGQIVTVDGAAESLPAGRVVAMSATRVYREDGSALSYSGAEVRGTLGRPSQVLTGGSGRDYALVGGRLWNVDSGHSEPAAGSFLLASPGGAEVTRVPTLAGRSGRLELRGTQVFRAGEETPLPLPGPAQAFGLLGDEAYILVGGAGSWQLVLLDQ
ncbi:MAG: hypothetical protein Q4C67_06755 [Deinococcus sp.]|nr:hypothetical protein [Deinococcus sp.]